MSIGLAADGARDALVALLIARVADGETGVPPRGRAGPGRPGAAVAAHAAIPALPAHLGDVGEQRADAVRVEALVAGVAHEHLGVLTGCPTRDAHFALAALPSGADARRRGQPHAAAVVVTPARHAHQLLIKQTKSTPISSILISQ